MALMRITLYLKLLKVTKIIEHKENNELRDKSVEVAGRFGQGDAPSLDSRAAVAGVARHVRNVNLTLKGDSS